MRRFARTGYIAGGFRTVRGMLYPRPMIRWFSEGRDVVKEPTDKPKPSGGLASRVLTAVVGVPVLLAVILAGPAWLWSMIVLVAVGIGLAEFYAMTTHKDEIVLASMGSSMGVLLAAMMVFAQQPLYLLTGCVTVVMVMLLAGVFAYRTIERALHWVSVGVTGVFYVALLTTFLALIRRDPGEMGRYWLLLLLAVVWVGDTGAYFCGRFLGRHKMAPTVSPKKTWEGAVGGLLVSIGAAFAVVALTPLSLHPYIVLAAAIPAAILGQLGDLCESLIKRSVGVKDSGRIIYGHGGILDRIDALMFAGPYLYFFYTYAGPAVLS